MCFLQSVPFKNENLYCEHTSPDGKTTVLATVPDLVCVIDAQNGAAIGTQGRLTLLPRRSGRRWC